MTGEHDVTGKNGLTSEDEFEVGADFTPIDSSQLKPIAVVAQCLDNQWVPRELLQQMLGRGLSLEDRAVAKRRAADSRAEYLRAVLNAEQVVVNRAFFFNNPTVYQDFRRGGPQRESFVKLLGDNVIVPFLFTEDSPGQPPRFTRDAVGWPAWKSLLDETSLSCLRLSWDAQQNERYVRRFLVQKFRRFLGTLGFLDEEGMRTDLGLDADAAARFTGVLREATTWAVNEPDVTRETFYKRFIVADDSDPALGRYDRSKPFAGELKQLVDLRYNTSLPDVLDCYPLTPTDSLHRTALQEERQILLDTRPVDPARLADVLLRRRVFDLVQQPLQVSLSGLDLSHVWQARQTDDWQLYLRHLQGLVHNPEEFDVRAQQVYDAYVQLATRLAEVVGDRRAATGPVWQPVIKVVIEVLGATMSLVFSGDPVVEVVGTVSEEVASRASDATVRFLVTHHDRRRARNQLATGIDLMRVRFARTGTDWQELLARFRESGLPVLPAGPHGGAENDPAMDNPGDADPS